jgi:hypothetical protein
MVAIGREDLIPTDREPPTPKISVHTRSGVVNRIGRILMMTCPQAQSGVGGFPRSRPMARTVVAIDMVSEFNPQRVFRAPDDPA